MIQLNISNLDHIISILVDLEDELFEDDIELLELLIQIREDYETTR